MGRIKQVSIALFVVEATVSTLWIFWKQIVPSEQQHVTGLTDSSISQSEPSVPVMCLEVGQYWNTKFEDKSKEEVGSFLYSDLLAD